MFERSLFNTTVNHSMFFQSIIGDLNREQNDFLQKKRERQSRKQIYYYDEYSCYPH